MPRRPARTLLTCGDVTDVQISGYNLAFHDAGMGNYDAANQERIQPNISYANDKICKCERGLRERPADELNRNEI